MYNLSEENIIQVWREDSATLMIVFSGIFPVAGSGPFDFLKETGFAASSLIYMHDFYRSGYSKGVSENLPSLEHVLQWCEAAVSGRSFDEVVVVGASSGALPAFLCAQRCGAKRAWGFGARPIKDGLFPPMSHEGSPYARWPQVKIGLNRKVAELIDRPARDWFAKRDVGWKLLDNQLEILAKAYESNGAGSSNCELKAYYVPSNKTDSLICEKMSRCSGITCFPVTLPDDYSGQWNKQPGWDHSVIQVMRLGRGVNTYLH